VSQLYLADRDLITDAAALMHVFGDYAADEAAIRASRSRSLGNVVHFCRWRQVERLLRWFAADAPTGTVH
jgi:hypothetical protein